MLFPHNLIVPKGENLVRVELTKFPAFLLYLVSLPPHTGLKFFFNLKKTIINLNYTNQYEVNKPTPKATT